MKRVGLVLLLLAMGVMGVEVCDTDNDCSTKQYCYKVSHNCVDYILCSNYKRQENINRSRNSLECGPCLPGYEDEVLSSGLKNSLCKIIEKPRDDLNTASLGLTLFWVIVLIALAVIIVTLTFVWIKKGANDWSGICVHTHNPPMEAGPFIKIEEPPLYTPVYDANSNINVSISKEKARLATATPFREPNWVQTNQLYNDQSSDDEEGYEASALVPLPPEEDTNPSSWVPEQLPIEDRPFRQFAIDRESASALVCAIPSTSSGNNSEPVPESSSAEHDDNQRQMPTIAILQKIELNLTVPKGDY